MLVAVMAAGSAFAQTQDAAEQVAAAPVPASACKALCAGSEVELELAEPISSERHKNGDRFRLRLAAPLVLDGMVVLPAGTPGIGEVIHAQASRGGGKPGELMLAARFLELPDGPLPLRAMKLAARGQDRAGSALATSFVAGPFAMFMHGREIEVPAGTHALAKLAQDLDPARAIAAPPSPAHTDEPATQTPLTTDAANASHIKE